MPGTMRGKKFIIAGYGEPLGEAIGRILVSEDGLPILVARNSERLKDAVEKMPGSNYYACDLSSEASLHTLRDFVKSSIGFIDGLVIMLGGYLVDRYDKIGDTLSLLNSNFSIPLKIISTLHDIFNEFSSIVFTSSTETLRITENSPLSYTASKYALNGLTPILAAQLLSRNIRVNEVAISSISEKYEAKRDWRKLRKMGETSTPAEDIADVVYFLLSDMSQMVDGATIPVDGGHRFRS